MRKLHDLHKGKLKALLNDTKQNITSFSKGSESNINMLIIFKLIHKNQPNFNFFLGKSYQKNYNISEEINKTY